MTNYVWNFHIASRNIREIVHTHRRTGDIQDPTYAGRNVAVKEKLRRLPRDAMSTPTNGIPTKPRNSAKPRSGRVQSYQPSAEVILFLPEEKGSNGSSSSSRLTTPGSTNGGKVASSRLDLAKDHSSNSRTEMRRPSSVHVWSQRVSRVTATKLAAKAKGDLPPIPSARQSRSPAPLSTITIPSARTAHRSRYSKLLPPTPIPVPGRQRTPHRPTSLFCRGTKFSVVTCVDLDGMEPMTHRRWKHSHGRELPSKLVLMQMIPFVLTQRHEDLL